MSVLPKFLLSLAILLFGGFGPLRAHAILTVEKSTAQACSESTKKHVDVYAGITSSKEHHKHQRHEVLFENEEENENTSLKKRRLPNISFADHSFAQACDFLSYARFALRFQRFPHSASSRYLVLQVFRI